MAPTLEDQLRLYGEIIDAAAEPATAPHRASGGVEVGSDDPYLEHLTQRTHRGRRVWWVAASVAAIVLGVVAITRQDATAPTPYLVAEAGPVLDRYLAPPAGAEGAHVVVQSNGATTTFTVDGVEYTLGQYVVADRPDETTTPDQVPVDTTNEGTIRVTCSDTTEGIGPDGEPITTPTVISSWWIRDGIDYVLSRSPSPNPTCADDAAGFLARQVESLQLLDADGWQRFVTSAGWATVEPDGSLTEH